MWQAAAQQAFHEASALHAEHAMLFSGSSAASCHDIWLAMPSKLNSIVLAYERSIPGLAFDVLLECLTVFVALNSPLKSLEYAHRCALFVLNSLKDMQERVECMNRLLDVTGKAPYMSRRTTMYRIKMAAMLRLQNQTKTAQAALHEALEYYSKNGHRQLHAAVLRELLFFEDGKMNKFDPCLYAFFLHFLQETTGMPCTPCNT